MKNKIITLFLTCSLCLVPASVYAAGPGDIIFSQCDNYVAMRENPDSESKIVGRLYNLSAATVLDEQEGWYEVTSGEISGWVDSSYFIEGAEAESLAVQQGYQVASPHVDAVNIRISPDDNSDIIDIGNSNNQLIVEDYDGGEWVTVSDEDGDVGYVKADYVEINNRYTVAVAEDLCETAETNSAQTVVQPTDIIQPVESYETETYLPEEEASFNEYYEENVEAEPQTEYYEAEVDNTEINSSYLRIHTITAYCGCTQCTGGLGVTASGTTPAEGWTVACNSLPFGTQISINGNTYEVQDTGNMDDRTIDIYMNSHEDAVAFGMQTADVYLVSDNTSVANLYGSYGDTSAQEETYNYTAETGYTTEYAGENYDTSETLNNTYSDENYTYDYSDSQVDIGNGYTYDTTTDTVTDTSTGEIYSGNSDIVSYARQFVGVTPYVWGGNSYTDGMDCSHFVWNVLKDTGAYSGGYVTSDGFANLGTPVNSLDEAQAGDVIVYNGHVAIYDGAGGIIEAQGSDYGTTNNRAADSSSIIAIRRFT